MNQSELRAKEAAAAIARIRTLQTSFSKEELIGYLKIVKCPYAYCIPTALWREGHLIKEGKVYIFTHNDPIYFGAVRKYLDHAYEINISSQKKPIKGLNLKEQHVPELVEFLKKQGYKIFKEL